MKLIRRIGVVLLVILLVLVGGAYLLPRYVAIERSLVIKAPKETIAPHIADLRQWGAWSPWAKLDPNMKVQYSEPSAGLGAWMAWQSDHENVGNGKMILTAIGPDSIAESMDFGMGEPARAAFYLLPADGGTQVKWTGHFDMGNNPMGRWMGLFVGDMVAKDYDRGLANLAQVAEK